jgi:hypothetical protein
MDPPCWQRFVRVHQPQGPIAVHAPQALAIAHCAAASTGGSTPPSAPQREVENAQSAPVQDMSAEPEDPPCRQRPVRPHQPQGPIAAQVLQLVAVAHCADASMGGSTPPSPPQRDAR